ncbi:CoA transferase [Georgenia sp. EYE_87]|uniref:CaiB/BaiF CoA transferase family protein n=1 Tax=Georgenia sp. EYE_87 TaxID=2853448 RepID=UPI0020051990|nr:CoA transferase [Georgenia sp. EYE_87]MCK6210236.1 CoA transferase [Georgenia sp. EYE_87]
MRVLEFTHYIAGPYCGQTLADLGAEVIKVEPPAGEASRSAEPMHRGRSLYYAAMNRNKQAVTLNLKHDDSRAVVRDLVERSDVVLTNYAYGVPERLGLDYETLRGYREDIVVAHITGFGSTGPLREKVSFDGIVQSMSGLVDLTGFPDGPPVKAGLFVSDHVAALHATIGILAALYRRQVTGRGEFVDVSLLDSTLSMFAYNPSYVSAMGSVPSRGGNRSANAFASVFPTKDGGYVYLAPMSPAMWAGLMQLIGRSEYGEPHHEYADPAARLRDYDQLEAAISEWTRQHSSAEVLSLLEERRIACGPVRTVDELFDDPQVRERQMLAEVDYDGVTATVPGRVVKFTSQRQVAAPARDVAKTVGADNEAVYSALGLRDADLAALRDRRVI